MKLCLVAKRSIITAESFMSFVGGIRMHVGDEALVFGLTLNLIVQSSMLRRTMIRKTKLDKDQILYYVECGNGKQRAETDGHGRKAGHDRVVYSSDSSNVFGPLQNISLHYSSLNLFQTLQ
jgi:hypothetical protein